MLEIEIKTRSEDNRKVEGMLLERGATLLGDHEQVDEYFNHPCRDFAETDEALRLRKDSTGKITYKGPKIDRFTKTREEIEMEIDDLDKMSAILVRLGFRSVARVKKKRREYLLDGVTVSLDSVEGLGDFVELEVQGEDAVKGRHMVETLRDELGLEGSERRSYLEMLMIQN
ncbi:MAG TPA: class IV adenylate cyclase [Methanomassiliicoccales archaeon]|jgi:adenylate cyclase class 2